MLLEFLLYTLAVRMQVVSSNGSLEQAHVMGMNKQGNETMN